MTMRESRRRIFATALVAGVLAVGCARDAKSQTSGSTSESFTASYQRITADLTERSREIKARSGEVKGTDVEKVLAVYERIKQSSEQAQRDLRSLQAPPAVSSQVARLVSLLGEQTDLLTKLIASAKAEDRAALSTALGDLLALTTEFDTARAQLESAIAACGAKCA